MDIALTGLRRPFAGLWGWLAQIRLVWLRKPIDLGVVIWREPEAPLKLAAA